MLGEVALGFVLGDVEGGERRLPLLLGLVDDMRGAGEFGESGSGLRSNDVQFGVWSWSCGVVAVESKWCCSELAGQEPRLKAVAGAEDRLRHEATIF